MGTHVHVYKVVGMIEVDVKPNDKAEAMTEAIESAKDEGCEMKPADCEFLAVIPQAKTKRSRKT